MYDSMRGLGLCSPPYRQAGLFLKTPYEATVFALTTAVVTWNVAELLPAGTVMVVGTCAFPGLLLASFTTTPPGGAGAG
jgi:hypothetical protein